MKVAVIHNFITPYVFGGASIIAENFACGLADAGIEVILITAGRNKKMEISFSRLNLKIYRFFPLNFYFSYPQNVRRNKLIKILWWALNLWNPFVFIKVRNVLKKEKPDLVNIQCFYGLSPSVFTSAQSLKIPVVFTAHDFSLLCWNGHFIRQGQVCIKRCLLCFMWAGWNKNFMNGIKFHFNSSFSEMIFKKYFKAKSLITLHNCTYLNKEEIESNISLREKKQQQSAPVSFIFVGFLSEYKGVLTLLEAFSKARPKNIELLIGGNGELEDKVIDYTKKDTRIKYFGFVSGEAKRELFLRGDVFVFPSQWYEVSPMVIQEAYAFGLPVIGTDFGSICEHIDVNETGWLFPYKDAAALAEKLEEVGGNRQGITLSSRKCFEKALRNMSGQNIEIVIDAFRNAS